MNTKKYQAKKQKISELSDNEQRAIKDKSNQASSEWRSNWRDENRENNPEKYEEFLQRSRRSQRKHYQSKQIAKLQRLGQQISEINDEKEE
jgi:hypothetical protein